MCGQKVLQVSSLRIPFPIPQTSEHVFSTYCLKRVNARRMSRIALRESAKGFTALLRIAYMPGRAPSRPRTFGIFISPSNDGRVRSNELGTSNPAKLRVPRGTCLSSHPLLPRSSCARVSSGGVPSLDLVVGLEGVSRSNLNFCRFKYFPSGAPLLH